MTAGELFALQRYVSALGSGQDSLYWIGYSYSGGSFSSVDGSTAPSVITDNIASGVTPADGVCLAIRVSDGVFIGTQCTSTTLTGHICQYTVSSKSQIEVYNFMYN